MRALAARGREGKDEGLRKDPSAIQRAFNIA